MNPSDNDTDQLLQEAEDLLSEINAGTEAMDAELFEPINKINALTDEVEADYNAKEGDLIEINEAYLEENEDDLAMAQAQVEDIFAEDEAE